jgi:hypothetical protein
MAEKDATTTAEQLKRRLAERLDAARGKIDELQEDLETIHSEDMEELRQKRDELELRLAEQKEKARALHTDIEKWKAEKVAHTEQAIGSWRRRHEIQKLQRRADRAEEYALDLVSVAAYDFEEAEQAILDAVAARFDAEAAQSAPP